MSIVKYNPIKINLEIALLLLPDTKTIKTLLDVTHSEWPRELAIKSLKQAREIVFHDSNHGHYAQGYKMAFIDVDPKHEDAWFSIEVREPTP